MIERLAAWMKLKPSQLVNALWLGAVLLAITGSYTLVKTARDTVFLSQLPAGWLPYVYVAVGAFALTVSWIFGRVTRRLSPLQSLSGTALVSAVVLVGFALLFPYSHVRVPVSFYLWVNAYGLIVTSQFWVYMASVSDPQEAKRIYGIVGAGGIVGGLVGGAIAAWLGPRVPIAWIASIGAAWLALVAPVLWFGIRGGRVRPSEEPPEEPEERAALAGAPYVRWLALAILCSVIVTGLLDFQMKVVVQRLYPTAPDLAGFFGRFHVVVGIAALLLQLLGTRWLLQKLGAGWTSVVLPAGLGIGTASSLIAPGFLSVVGTRMWDQVVRFSVNKSAVEMFYLPIEPELRRRAKAFIEAGIERFGDALAGLVILGLALALEPSPVAIAGVAAVLVLTWLVAWWKLRAGYVRELGRNLRRMNLQGEPRVSLHELSVLKELVRMLESPYENVVLSAFELLEENAEKLLEPRLPGLLRHPSAQVRTRALSKVAERRTEEARAEVVRLTRDPDPVVRVQALRAHCALGDGSAMARLQDFLQHPEIEVRGAALACVAELASDEEMPALRDLIERRLDGAEAAERVAAVRALGARAWPSPIHELLGRLFDDQDPTVRRAALESAGTARSRDHVSRLIAALGEPETYQAARQGLLAFGEGVTGTLSDWLCDERVALAIRRSIPRILGDLPVASSVAALYRCRLRGDQVLLYRVLKASNHIRMADPRLSFPSRVVTEYLTSDVRAFLVAERHLRSQGKGVDESERFLRLVLLERMDQGLNRIFRRLALLYPPSAMFSAYLGLLSPDRRVRGSALEYVENVLDAEHRELVLPLLPLATAEDRRRLAESLRLHEMSRHDSLAALLADEDPWLRACALYVAGRRRESSLASAVESNLADSDERVRETATWAREALKERAA